MKLYLLRHGETAWNVQGRYQGVSDIPLSPEGMAALRPADFAVGTVIVSPLARARQTAQILFPKAAQEVEPGLQEMNFGTGTDRWIWSVPENAALQIGMAGEIPDFHRPLLSVHKVLLRMWPSCRRD